MVDFFYQISNLISTKIILLHDQVTPLIHKPIPLDISDQLLSFSCPSPTPRSLFGGLLLPSWRLHGGDHPGTGQDQEQRFRPGLLLQVVADAAGEKIMTEVLEEICCR